MSVFTEPEIAFLVSQRLGRLATVNQRGDPQNAPVAFAYNAALDTIDIRGRDLTKTQKFKNVSAGRAVAFVADDVQAPWKPRCVEIRGTAEAITDSDGPLIRVHPRQVIAFGIETDSYTASNRKVG